MIDEAIGTFPLMEEAHREVICSVAVFGKKIQRTVSVVFYFAMFIVFSFLFVYQQFYFPFGCAILH